MNTQVFAQQKADERLAEVNLMANDILMFWERIGASNMPPELIQMAMELFIARTLAGQFVDISGTLEKA